jgi:phosphoglycolate phosphatase-like HAD superfamily hydrolase/protein-L-isoaspartate O-methyltransferase
MKLAIFDIDGTLTKTNDVDTQCFVKAFALEFGIENINTDWASYGHTTDSGITLQIFQEFLGRVPKESELSRFQHRFVDLLQECYTGDNTLFAEIPGAAVMLRKLREAEDWAIAFATGGWCASACMKLDNAGLNIGQLPTASADDGISREDIVKTAISRAKAVYAQSDFEKIVCIGDGIWDVLTAVQLQLNFVGVASGEQKIILQDAGVEQIIEDFVNFDSFLEALNTASIPKAEKLLEVQKRSLPPSYFEALYGTDPDPWKFETSEYEAKKYAATIAALPKRYKSAFEIGGSIGVLTEKLASLCDSLLSIDVSKLAQEKAIQRCQHLKQVRFEIMRLPEQYPEEMFDLVLVSEVGYYWCWSDLQKAKQCILEHLEPGGHLLLVHWTEYARDYPLNGDQVHDSFMELIPTKLRHLKSQREEQYRLDLFERI